MFWFNKVPTPQEIQKSIERNIAKEKQRQDKLREKKFKWIKKAVYKELKGLNKSCIRFPQDICISQTENGYEKIHIDFAKNCLEEKGFKVFNSQSSHYCVYFSLYIDKKKLTYKDFRPHVADLERLGY